MAAVTVMATVLIPDARPVRPLIETEASVSAAVATTAT